MTAAGLDVLLVLLFLLILFAVIFIIQKRQQSKQLYYEKRIHDLESNLTQSNVQLNESISTLKNVREGILYETYAKRIISHLDQGIIYIDQYRIVQFINAYAQRFLNMSTGVGKTYRDVIHIHETGDTSDAISMFEKAFAGSAQILPDHYEMVCLRGSVPIRGTIFPLPIDHSVNDIVFIFTDNSTEEARIKEEQAFFSTAAHELRTPLTVIRMTISLLREKLTSLPQEKIIEHLGRADETAEQLVKMVNDFLNVSRIDQGRLEMQIESFDIVNLTEDVIHAMTLIAKERNLYIHHEPIGIENRMVIGDRAKTNDILTNVISNGLKYTMQGGLTIAHHIVGSSLATKITDTGTGIPLEYQPLLFKRFQQIGEAHELAPTKSTGLGLYISKKLALMMHGDVVLEKSEPGKGSTFSFTLPLG